MTGEISLRERIRNALDRYPANDDSTVALAVLNDLKVPRLAAECIGHLVTAEVGAERRAEIRDLERRAFPRNAPRQKQLLEGGEPIDMLAARAELIRDGFWRKDGRRIEFAKATVVDHEDRISWFRSHISGCQRTIDVHKAAIAAIRTAGVSCLAEIEEVA